jgi:hypothetical protein
MKKFIPMLVGISLFALGLASCNKPGGMDEKTMNNRIDSSYNAQKQGVMDEMNKVCADNMAANVQMKADSIVNASRPM